MIPDYPPMLAVSWPGAFSDSDWLFEPKWDGYRALLSFDGARTRVRSRGGSDLTGRYPEVAAARFGRPVVLDGELVVFGAGGRPSFELLQQRSGRLAPTLAGSLPVVLIVFDVLGHGDTALLDQPLEARLEILAGLDLPDSIRRSPVIDSNGLALWETVLQQDLEGMVAKRKGSPYRPGVRSDDWRKVAHTHTARVVVGGFTPGEGGRAATFGSLLVGLWDGDLLRWAGAVGTGFSASDLVAIRDALDQQQTPVSPFHPEAELPRNARWVEPALVAAVGYRNWTSAGRLRQPRFLGFTDDDQGAISLLTERLGTNDP